MKKISILIGALFCSSALFSQEVLSLKQCREMALQYNKEMAASVRQTESARYMAKSIKEISFRILRRVGPVFIAVPVDIMV